jgi:hypothetical protein
LILHDTVAAASDFAAANKEENWSIREVMAVDLLRYACRASGSDPDAMIAELRDGGTTLRKEYTVEKLGDSARAWAGVAQNLRGTSWLPFNQRLAAGADGRVVERLEGIERVGGMSAVQAEVSKSGALSIGMNRAVSSIGDRNSRLLPGETQVKAVGGTTSLVFGTYAAFTPELGTKIAAAKVAAAAKVGEAVAGKAIESSNYHVAFANRFSETKSPMGYRPPEIPDQTRGGTRIDPGQKPDAPVPGGADLSLRKIAWDNGDWPFRPLYGLAYGLQESLGSPTTQPTTQPIK